jgi:bacterioferritin (cytochrome b1)
MTPTTHVVHQQDHIAREDLIGFLNEDLAGEYQAIISYVIYSQVLKGPEYMAIAAELEVHAAEELSHALIIAKQIDYLGGMPQAVPKPVKLSTDAKEMLTQSLAIASGFASATRSGNMRWRNKFGRSWCKSKNI